MLSRRTISGLAASLTLLALSPALPSTGLFDQSAYAASEVAVVVNKEPITSFAIQERIAFLKLRRVGGNLTEVATDELIDEALKKQEMRRQGISVPDAAVDEAYANFAASNNLTLDQLQQVLSRAGFSTRAFKDYIRTQIGWGEAVRRNVRQEQQLSEQEVVQRMLAQGGEKPSTTEYTLQQVIFVIPEGASGTLDRRMQEANAMRARFQSCDSTYQFAQGLRDVTVRDLGRVAQPELPSFWKSDIEGKQPGQTTPAKQTERGVEFIGICDTRTISDDKVAAMVYQMRDLQEIGKSEPDQAFLDELREKAQIVRP